MPNASWKEAERRVARVLGGVRVGATGVASPEPELKPCPFCGSDDVILASCGYLKHVYCLHCHAQGPSVGIGVQDGNAIRSWNRVAESCENGDE